MICFRVCVPPLSFKGKVSKGMGEQKWMDPKVARALNERNKVLREHGFPERLQEYVEDNQPWQYYQREGGINPLVFCYLEPEQWEMLPTINP